MGEKKFTIVEIIVAIVITIIIMLLFWENDASNLRNDISIRDEKIQELENEIGAENPELSAFQEQLDEIQSTVDNIYDGLTIEEPVLEIFGLKLYLDDLIILALLYFLYAEDVKDDMLFISLILLLLS